MASKRGPAKAAGAALLAGLAVWAGHALHLVGEEVGPVIQTGWTTAGGVLHDQGLSAAAKQGVSTFREMRKGTEEEKIVVSAACAVMSSSASGTTREDEFEAAIRHQLPPSTGNPFEKVGDRYVQRAATTLTIAEQDGGLGNWYVRYCVGKI